MNEHNADLRADSFGGVNFWVNESDCTSIYEVGERSGPGSHRPYGSQDHWVERLYLSPELARRYWRIDRERRQMTEEIEAIIEERDRRPSVRPRPVTVERAQELAEARRERLVQEHEEWLKRHRADERRDRSNDLKGIVEIVHEKPD